MRESLVAARHCEARPLIPKAQPTAPSHAGLRAAHRVLVGQAKSGMLGNRDGLVPRKTRL